MARLVIRLLALSAVLVGLLALVMPGHALAARRLTDTPVPSATPYPTYTPAPAGTPYPTATALPVRGQVQLSSSSGMDGSALIAAASGFSPGVALSLTWDGVELATATTDGDGYSRLNFRVPRDATQGPHEVRVRGPHHESATALYQVAQTYRPTLTLAAAQVTQGKAISALGAGFAPGTAITFYLDSIAATNVLGTANADASGNAQYDLAITAQTTARSHRLIAASDDPALRAYAFVSVQAPPPVCGGISIPLPFVDPLCIDAVGFLTTTLSNAATGAASAVGAQVAPALISQPDYTQNGPLAAAFDTVQSLARDLFGVLFLAGVLTWYVRRMGLGSPGDAGIQIVEAAFGLALVQFLPTLLSLSVDAANGLSSAILGDPTHEGGVIIASLVTHLAPPALVGGLTALPLLLIVLTGVVLAALTFLLLIIITRDIGIVYGAAVFVAAPLCVVCGITPLTRGVATAWARLWISLTLWGVWYALALVVVRAELDTFVTQGGLDALAGALAGLLVIYGAPKLGDALIGGGATRALGIGQVPLLSTVIGTATGMATAGSIRGIGDTVAAGGGGATPATAVGSSAATATGDSSASAASPGGSWGPINGAGV